MRVTIIGAGVAGLCCALEFAECGAEVEIVERNDSLGQGNCSWYAGGMLAPWCESATAEPIVSRMGVESIGWWSRHFPATVRNGTLVVAHGRDRNELKRFSQRTEHHRWLNRDEIGELEPELAGRFEQALFFPDEAHLDPRAALGALAERLSGLGVPIHFGIDAAQWQSSAQQIVDCTGFAARKTLFALRGVKGEMLVLRSNELAITRPIRLLHPRLPLYVVPRGHGLFMLGATMIESDDARRITARSMLELLSAAYALHPAFGEAEIVEIGTEVRPAFPDNLPRVLRVDGKLYVNGLYRHGYLLAPALARVAADVALSGVGDMEWMGLETGHENSVERRLA